MKKEYSKPQILFENFVLNVNIAGNCDHDNSLQTEASQCGFEWGGDIIFLSGISACKEKYDVDDGSSGLCYDVPHDTMQIFNS